MGPSDTLSDETRSQKSKMAAEKTKETSLITDRCLVQQEVLYGTHLKM